MSLKLKIITKCLSICYMTIGCSCKISITEHHYGKQVTDLCDNHREWVFFAPVFAIFIFLTLTL